MNTTTAQPLPRREPGATDDDRRRRRLIEDRLRDLGPVLGAQAEQALADIHADRHTADH